MLLVTCVICNLYVFYVLYLRNICRLTPRGGPLFSGEICHLIVNILYFVYERTALYILNRSL
jgi:hypothetical protein